MTEAGEGKLRANRMRILKTAGLTGKLEAGPEGLCGDITNGVTFQIEDFGGFVISYQDLKKLMIDAETCRNRRAGEGK